MKKKILIVDDEALVRKSLNRACSQLDAEVIEADNGILAVELWKNHTPDLVFLDVLMPGLTGPQVINEISLTKGLACPIILMSAYTGEYNLEKAQSVGANLFISKPFDDIFNLVKIAKDFLYERRV